MCSRVPKYENAVQKMFHQQLVIDPDILKDFSQFPEMEHICYPEISERGSVIVDLTLTTELVKKDRNHTPGKDSKAKAIKT